MKEDMLNRAQKEYANGEQARKIIENPAFERAFEAIEHRLIEDFKASRWFEGKQMKEIHRKLKAAEWFRQALESELESGKLALKRLEAK